MFIHVIGSELVQKYVGEGARMVRELFEMARSKKACIIFFDEVDAIGGARFDDGARHFGDAVGAQRAQPFDTHRLEHSVDPRRLGFRRRGAG